MTLVDEKSVQMTDVLGDPRVCGCEQDVECRHRVDECYKVYESHVWYVLCDGLLVLHGMSVL